jgi:PilZ domain-containing protein
VTEVVLELEQDVVVEVPGMGRLAARVTDVVGKRVGLSLFLPPGDSLRVSGAQDAVIEFAAPRGIYRIVGIARDLAGDGLTLHFHQELDPALIQRREFARADAIVPVQVWPRDGYGEPIATNTLNLSGNGMLLNGVDIMRPGDGFRFVLDLPDEGEPIDAHARVVREGPHGQRGCAFETVPEDDRERIVRFVFERQRLERLTAAWEDR